MSSLGSIGMVYELVVRRGATAGPVTMTVTAGDQPYSLTGHTLEGWVCQKLSQKRVAPVTVAILDAQAGQIRFEVTDENTALLPPDPDLVNKPAAHYWFLDLLLPDGRRRPLFWGDAPVWRG